MMAGCRVGCWLVLSLGTWVAETKDRETKRGREGVRVEDEDRESECRRGSEEARKEKDTKAG